MYKRSEGFFAGYEDIRLYHQVWAPAQSQGHLVITHGHGEHSDCYLRVVDALAPLSLTIHGWDLRGHGRSDGQRGYAKTFDHYIYDMEAFIRTLRRESAIEKKGFALLAHSMGGLIQTRALLQNQHWPVSRQVLSSPMFGLALEVPFIKDLAALVLNKLIPALTLGNQIENSDVTRDPEVIKELSTDVLRHDRMSAGAYLGSLEAMQMLKSSVQKIQGPTLFQIAEEDPVAKSDDIRALFKKWGSAEKILKQYPGRKHEIYNDLGREEVFTDLIGFLK